MCAGNLNLFSSRSFQMGGTSGEQIFEQDLDDTEGRVVQDLCNWLADNPDAQWEPSPRNKSVEQCPQKGLRHLLKPLESKHFKFYIFRTSHTGWKVHEEGKLIPIYPSEGCSIKDGDTSYPLRYGTKLHISKQVTMEIANGNTVYLLWIIKR
ncbi:hypothetical protein CDD83_8032 [Cordyceps sp. RAO-2017]|nr:hypothetical protein CDD83_8032 [Cordyceps sp. RAO-2017]